MPNTMRAAGIKLAEMDGTGDGFLAKYNPVSNLANRQTNVRTHVNSNGPGKLGFCCGSGRLDGSKWMEGDSNRKLFAVLLLFRTRLGWAHPQQEGATFCIDFFIPASTISHVKLGLVFDGRTQTQRVWLAAIQCVTHLGIVSLRGA
jgi:hypothetical protein